MFNPTKTWRRWHRKVNVTQKRHAVASSLAASALTPLVMARGHRVDEVSELPLVVSDGVQSIAKTKKAVEFLNGIGLKAELEKVLNSKKIHTGRGKSRNRRYTMRRGPLVVYEEDNGISRAFRAIPGVDLCHVDRLNLLKLAPGGTFGRLIVWTEPAFKKLQVLFGSYKSGSSVKKGYHLPRAPMVNADIARIINSDEVQSVVDPAKEGNKRFTQKKNPLKNKEMMAKLNPGINKRKRDLAAQHTDGDAKEKVQAKKRARLATAKKHKTASREFYNKMMASYETKPETEEVEEADED